MARVIIPFTDYRLAAGYNVALASMTLIETIIDDDGYPLPAPTSLFNYDPGAYRVRGDGTLYLAGYSSVSWEWSGLRAAAARKLQADFCSGGYSGKVTVYTRTTGLSYTRYNAVMILPAPASVQRQGSVLRDYVVRFTRLEVAS